MHRLLPLVRVFARLPDRAGVVWARLHDAGTRPFDAINYHGSCAAARVTTGGGWARGSTASSPPCSAGWPANRNRTRTAASFCRWFGRPELWQMAVDSSQQWAKMAVLMPAAVDDVITGGLDNSTEVAGGGGVLFVVTSGGASAQPVRAAHVGERGSDQGQAGFVQRGRRVFS